jgi:hypothetical protein
MVGPPGQPTAAKRVATFSHAKEGAMKLRWNEMMRALVLVRLGQELGTDSRVARLVHDWITLVLTLGGILG